MSKHPLVSLIQFIRSKLPLLDAGVNGVAAAADLPYCRGTAASDRDVCRLGSRRWRLT